jgi:hypothetical protein
MFSANAKKDLCAARAGRWFFRLRVDFEHAAARRRAASFTVISGM